MARQELPLVNRVRPVLSMTLLAKTVDPVHQAPSRFASPARTRAPANVSFVKVISTVHLLPCFPAEER